ncbi:MAG: endo-1,4-beta-xylanase [Acutalibacteraceae bacterium]|jgi:endo-1,4-beta-xylanase
MTFMEKCLNESSGYKQETQKKINQCRTGEFCLKVKSNNSNIKNIKLSYKLKRHDFDFGCNIFMLNQYDSQEETDRYLELWKGLFNTAVVPLYWEGTEPEKGKLRYTCDSDNNIYRRPPAQTVVNYCKQNGITPKGHPLFWHEFIPRWLPTEWNELLPLIERRFAEISELFGADIPVFDLLNEPSRIWDMTFEHKNDGYFMVAPPKGYIEQICALGAKYFPNNKLIINDAVSASFVDFRGVYGGYYQLLERLIRQNERFDKIGLQCHTSNSENYKNVFCADRLADVLKTYGSLGKEVVISEISIVSSDSEELQAQAAELLYRVAFAEPSVSGVFWWNLDDNGILTVKNRDVMGENLPSAGLVRNGVEKQSYKTLKNLIKNEWNTSGDVKTETGKTITFNGFYGIYEVEISAENFTKTFEVDLSKHSEKSKVITLDY